MVDGDFPFSLKNNVKYTRNHRRNGVNVQRGVALLVSAVVLSATGCKKAGTIAS
jgi:hypothetical protein